MWSINLLQWKFFLQVILVSSGKKILPAYIEGSFGLMLFIYALCCKLWVSWQEQLIHMMMRRWWCDWEKGGTNNRQVNCASNLIPANSNPMVHVYIRVRITTCHDVSDWTTLKIKINQYYVCYLCPPMYKLLNFLPSLVISFYLFRI